MNENKPLKNEYGNNDNEKINEELRNLESEINNDKKDIEDLKAKKEEILSKKPIDPMNISDDDIERISKKIANEAHAKFTNTEKKDDGISVGKETIAIPKGRIQELVDNGMKKSEAIEEAKKEILEKLDSSANNQNETNNIKQEKVKQADKKENVVEAPKLKLEGETFIINGQAVTVESTQGNGKFMVRSISTGKIEQVDSKEIENSAKERDIGLKEKFKNRFGFSEKEILELDQNPEYQKLSFGQKRFVLDSLTTSTIEKIEEVSDKNYKQKTASKGFFGRFVNNMFRETKMSGVRKRVYDEIKNGGYENQKESINAIIARADAMGVPMIENEKGELEVQYAEQITGMLKNNPKSLWAQRAFNQAATDLHNIPPEWESETATRGQRAEAKVRKDIYDARRQACFSFNKDGGEIASEEMLEQSSLVDCKVNLNRLMNSNPGNEKMLNQLNRYSSGGILKNIAKDLIFKENRLTNMGIGMGIRGITKYFEVAGLASAGIVSGAVGGIKGYDKARNMVRDDENKLRRGAETDSKGRASEMLKLEERSKGAKHNSYIDKINGIIKKIETADEKGDEESAVFYKTMLKNRVDYALDRASKGKVTFGDSSVRLGNQAAFTSAINMGASYSLAADPKIMEKYQERMTGLIENDLSKDAGKRAEQKKFVRNFTIRNAALGVAFGMVGYAARDVINALREAGGVEHIAEAIKNTGTVPATEIPNTTIPPHEPFTIKHEIPGDAYIKKGEGIENALRRQIEHNPDMAKKLGWDGKTPLHKFSGGAAHRLATEEGYVDPKTGSETRVRFTGDKDSFYEIKKQADGSYDIEEGNGSTYADSDTNEYIYKNGVKTGVIEQQRLTGTEVETNDGNIEANDAVSETNDGTVETNDGNIETNDGNVETKISPEAESHASSVAKVQYGKSLNNSEHVGDGTRHRNYLTPQKSDNSQWENYVANKKNHGSNYLTPQGQNAYYQQGNSENFIQNDKFGFPRSHNGEYFRTVKIDGKDTLVNTHSTNVSSMFDGKVNRQYSRLIGDTFGERNAMTGDVEVNREINNMLRSNIAEDDIHSKAGENASENAKNYYNIIQSVHEKSGLEPREGEPTSLYIREALQKMKDDGVNIRKFISNILDHDSVKHINKNVVDDVYR